MSWTAISIGAGQTGKTTAHLMPWNDNYYHEIESNWGIETMKVVAESHRSSIDFVERVIKERALSATFSEYEVIWYLWKTTTQWPRNYVW